jgi:hypothetical protein
MTRSCWRLQIDTKQSCRSSLMWLLLPCNTQHVCCRLQAETKQQLQKCISMWLVLSCNPKAVLVGRQMQSSECRSELV